MGRINGATNRSKSKPQGAKRSGGSKQSRQRNDKAFKSIHNNNGGMPPQARRRNGPSLQIKILRRDGIETLSGLYANPEANSSELGVITEALRATHGNKSQHFLQHTILKPGLAQLAIKEHGEREFARILTKLEAERSEDVPYKTKRVFTNTGHSGTTVVGISPTGATIDALNLDIIDMNLALGLEERFRHRSLILGEFYTKSDAGKAADMLHDQLQSAGGVLVTFAGAQIIHP